MPVVMGGFDGAEGVGGGDSTVALASRLLCVRMGNDNALCFVVVAVVVAENDFRTAHRII